MGRIEVTPSVWNFSIDPGFVWPGETGQGIMQTNQPVQGANPADGTGGSINAALEDLYNRVGFAKRTAESAGNRGYTKHVVINSSRALTMADAGIIKVATAEVGGSPSTAVELTLPTRSELVAGGVGWFERSASSPFLSPQGGGIVNFIVYGYNTTTGVPLKIKVPTPTSPPSPVSGDDIAQNIVIGNHSHTEIYLYDGDYAEFVPIIGQSTATGLWYTTWAVFVHQSRYQKFTAGGGGSSVDVTGGVPVTNMEKVGDYYNFTIANGGSLSYLPDNSTTGQYSHRADGAAMMIVRVSTATAGNSFSITHNGGSAPAGYKKIMNPGSATFSLKDGTVLTFIEDGAQWRLVNYVGPEDNPTYLKALLSIEQLARANGDNSEASTRASADNSLQAQINAILAAWVNTTPTLFTSTNIDDPPSGVSFVWKQIGKTVHTRFSFTIDSTTSSGSTTVVFTLPNSWTGAGPAYNAIDATESAVGDHPSSVRIGLAGNYTRMVFDIGGVDAGGETIEVNGTLTFEIV